MVPAAENNSSMDLGLHLAENDVAVMPERVQGHRHHFHDMEAVPEISVSSWSTVLWTVKF